MMYRNKMILLFIVLSMSISVCAEITKVDKNALLGQWQLDMSPHVTDDDSFAWMHIKEITDDAFAGEFYRQGVPIQQAQINTQLGVLHAALISKDNSGQYHSSFYLKGETLYGTTHAIERGFLAVWTAKKIKHNAVDTD